MKIHTIVISVFVAVATIAGPAYAADAAAKLKEAGEDLKKIAEHIEDAHKKDAAYKIGEAITLLDRLDDDLAEAKGSADGDPKILTVVEQWLRLRDNLMPKLRILLEMEKAQERSEREIAELLKQCVDSQKELVELGDKLIRARDAKKMEDLKNLSEKYKRDFEPKMKALHDKVEKIEDLKEDASRFDGPDLWDKIADNLRESADGILDDFENAEKGAKNACDQLTKGPESGDIVKALATLRSFETDADRVVRDLISDHARFKEAVTDLRRWHKHEIVNLREVFCENVEEVEGTRELKNRVAESVADRVAINMRNYHGDISAAAGTLLSNIDSQARPEKGLTDDDLERLKKIRGSVERINRSVLKAISSSGSYRGANNPRIRVAMEVGKDAHSRYQSANCTGAEITIDKFRIDCVVVAGNTCTIIEIKPNNPRAMELGKKQVLNYQTAVLAKWKESGSKEFTGSLAVFAPCITGARPRLSDPKVVTYEFCPSEKEFGEGEEVTFISEDDEIGDALEEVAK